MAERIVSANGKRPADSEQSVDTFAVCTNCSRLSNNLHKCDKCGSALSEDNTALCYSAEPKRARVETSAPSPTSNPIANGGSSPQSTTTSAPTTPTAVTSQVGVSSSGLIPLSRMNQTTVVGNGSATLNSPLGTPTPIGGMTTPTAATPVPQTLYVNTGQAITPTMLGPQIRPQQLYMNVNNQVFPVPVMAGAATSAPNTSSANVVLTSTARTMPPPLAATGTRQTVSNLTNTTAVLQSQTMSPVSNVPPQRSTVNALPNSGQRTSFGVPNLSPQQSLDTAAAGAVNSSQPPPPYPNNNSSSNTNSNTQQSSTGNSDVKVCLVARQIRIGLKRFNPATKVTFKSEGVLFSLEDYSNAPVLLNARAILKCKANMDTQFPVFFFLLEGSCVKQIQTIFHLNDTNFTDKNTHAEKLQYISIFPLTVSANDVWGIKRVFKSMQQKYNRPYSILEEIDADGVIEILYSSTSIHQPATSAVVNTVQARPNMTTVNSPRPSQMPTASQILRTAASAAPTLPSMVPTIVSDFTAAAGPRHNLASLTNSQLQGNRANTSLTTVQATTPAPLYNRNSASTPPTLVIPSDNARWQQMQKSLVVGGVYQVQFHTGQKKYCLWNGSTFVPCLVQDTEVQLQVTHVRIGHLKTSTNGFVRVRSEGNQAGIAFTIRIPNGTYKELHIPLGTIVGCAVCFDRVPTMYIYPTANYAEALRSSCGLRRQDYDPGSKDDKERHIILFLKDINRDQKDALSQMKVTNTYPPRPFIKEMDSLASLAILAKIKENSQGTMNRVGTDLGLNANKDSGATAANSMILDDDDDVIMTSEEIGIKCPYTQQVMKDPVRNRICGHNYEKMAIREFIARRAGKGSAKCPYAGCGNTVPLNMNDLEDNLQLKEYIRTKQLAT